MRSATLLSLALLLGSGCTPGFTKIVDLKTAVPHSFQAKFTEFQHAAFDGTQVVLIAKRDDEQGGLYRWSANTSLSLIAETGQVLPGVNDDLLDLYSVTADAGKIAVGTRIQQGGYAILSDATGIFQPVVMSSLSTPPLGMSYFAIQDPWIASGQIAYWAQINPLDTFGSSVMLLNEMNVASKIAGKVDHIPGTMLPFDMTGVPVMYGSAILFFGSNGPGQQTKGLYLHTAGGLSKVADNSTPIPDGAGSFTESWQTYGFDGAEDNLLFIASGTNQMGIYRSQGGTLTSVVDLNTPWPAGFGFSTFYNLGPTGAGTIVFLATTGTSGGKRGVFTTFNGEIEKVIAPGDELDGNIVTDCWFDPQSVRGSQLVVRIQSTDSQNQPQDAFYLVDLAKIEQEEERQSGTLTRAISRLTHAMRF